MLDRVFGESALHLNKKLEAAAATGRGFRDWQGGLLSELRVIAATLDAAPRQQAGGSGLRPAGAHTLGTPLSWSCSQRVDAASMWCQMCARQPHCPAGEAIDMEACFSQLTLDVIGKVCGQRGWITALGWLRFSTIFRAFGSHS